MIGPGGLLLVVPTYLQSQFQASVWNCKKRKYLNLDVRNIFAVSGLWVELQKRKYLNLDVRNIFAGSHTQHKQGGCSYGFLPLQIIPNHNLNLPIGYQV
jgi:hypothetical protein